MGSVGVEIEGFRDSEGAVTVELWVLVEWVGNESVSCEVRVELAVDSGTNQSIVYRNHA